MSETVSIASDGDQAARVALERCVGEGGVVVFPADTLYGLACDPLNERAATRINEIKGRDSLKPSAVMYFSPLSMRELIEDQGSRARDAIAALLPGPVTLVIRNAGRRYELACGKDPEKLGVRLIQGPLAGAATPVLQTSANRSGQPAPSRFEEVPEGILARVDLAIDGGELGGEPSTVVDISGIDHGGGWAMIREGAVSEVVVNRALGDLPSRSD